jgi:hypothetical protein
VKDAQLLLDAQRPPLLVALPQCCVIATQLVEIPPGEQPGVMAVVENQFYSILSNGLDGSDADILLAEHQNLLSRAMSFDFRGGRMNSKVLERQLEAAAVRKTHFQQPRFAADFDFCRDGFSHVPVSIGPGL